MSSDKPFASYEHTNSNVPPRHHESTSPSISRTLPALEITHNPNASTPYVLTQDTSVARMPPTSFSRSAMNRSSDSTSSSSSSSIICYTNNQPQSLPVWDINSSLGLGNDDTSDVTYLTPSKTNRSSSITASIETKQPARKKRAVTSDVLQRIKNLDPNDISINDIKVVALFDQHNSAVHDQQGRLVYTCDTIMDLPANKFTLDQIKNIIGRFGGSCANAVKSDLLLRLTSCVIGNQQTIEYEAQCQSTEKQREATKI